MTIIDTPGLIHPPRGTSLTAQQQALADAAEATEALVVEKMRCRDYVILCVEDTSDWKHATTRNIVMQVCESCPQCVGGCSECCIFCECRNVRIGRPAALANGFSHHQTGHQTTAVRGLGRSRRLLEVRLALLSCQRK